MSYPVAIGSVVRVVTHMTIPGQVATCKRDYQLTAFSTGSVVDAQQLVEAIDFAQEALWKGILCLDATYYGVQMYLQTPTGPRPRPVSTKASNGGGVGDADLLPTQSAGLISLYTDTLGRAGQGRVYAPFPSQGDCGVDGTPNEAYLVKLRALGEWLSQPHLLPTGVMNTTISPCLYLPGGVPPKPIIQYVARDGWATQRRRGSFGRTNSSPF